MNDKSFFVYTSLTFYNFYDEFCLITTFSIYLFGCNISEEYIDSLEFSLFNVLLILKKIALFLYFI
jgi:hypothetical protein